MESLAVEVQLLASTTSTFRVCHPGVVAEIVVVPVFGAAIFKVGDDQAY